MASKRAIKPKDAEVEAEVEVEVAPHITVDRANMQDETPIIGLTCPYVGRLAVNFLGVMGKEEAVTYMKFLSDTNDEDDEFSAGIKAEVLVLMNKVGNDEILTENELLALAAFLAITGASLTNK